MTETAAHFTAAILAVLASFVGWVIPKPAEQPRQPAPTTIETGPYASSAQIGAHVVQLHWVTETEIRSDGSRSSRNRYYVLIRNQPNLATEPRWSLSCDSVQVHSVDTTTALLFLNSPTETCQIVAVS